jgi:hypothetical protein
MISIIYHRLPETCDSRIGPGGRTIVVFNDTHIKMGEEYISKRETKKQRLNSESLPFCWRIVL